MTVEANGFMEYLELQSPGTDLVTKSELISEVRKRGYSIGERQLAFYVSEQIVPKSVRVGSRAGAYPRIVIDLVAWVTRARDGGLTIESIRELLPVWKYLTRARRDGLLELSGLEYMARQHVKTVEASVAIPAVVGDLLHACEDCAHEPVQVLMKDGTRASLDDTNTTLGFAIARKAQEVDDEGKHIEGDRSVWFLETRITLARTPNPASDPSTVVLGVGPNEALPGDDTLHGELTEVQTEPEGVPLEG